MRPYRAPTGRYLVALWVIMVAAGSLTLLAVPWFVPSLRDARYPDWPGSELSAISVATGFVGCSWVHSLRMRRRAAVS